MRRNHAEKENKGIHLALVRSHCLSRLGIIGVTRIGYITDLQLVRYVGYILVDNSHLHTTPQAPLNHSGVCLCELMFGQVLSGGCIRE